MGFFAMIASMLLGILFVVIGISRRKQKGWPIILIALGILFVLIAIYLGWPKQKPIKPSLPSGRKEKNAAGQADFSCPNALSSGGFDSKPLFLYPLAAHRRMPPCDYRQIGTCQKKPASRSGIPYPCLRKQSFFDGSYCYAPRPNGLAPYGRFSISGPATLASLPFPALPRSDPKNLNGGKDDGNYYF